MLKTLMRWIDSWFTPTAPETLTAENSKIQWQRILPFILLHLACLAVFWVGVSWFAVGFMLLFYLIRMFSITAFFHRYLSHKTFQTSRPVQFLFVLLGTMSAPAWPLVVGSPSSLSPPLYRFFTRPTFIYPRFLV